MDQRLPSVSIGLPVFNGEDYLAQALDSLLAQTFSDFELVISDNASTDRTPQICQDYMNKDKRIRYSRNPTNLGGAYNDNQVFRLSLGKYFKWAGHDDLHHPMFLERCVDVLEHNPTVVLCYPKTIIIDERGQLVEYYEDHFDLRSTKPHERFGRVIGNNQMLNCFYGLILTSVLKTTQLVQNYAASDRVLLGELTLRGMFYEVPEYLFYRRVHPRKSTKANVTDEETAVWFDPRLEGKILAPRWRRMVEFNGAIGRASLSWSEQIMCYVELWRFYIHPSRLPGALRDLSQARRIARPSL